MCKKLSFMTWLLSKSIRVAISCQHSFARRNNEKIKGIYRFNVKDFSHDISKVLLFVKNKEVHFQCFQKCLRDGNQINVISERSIVRKFLETGVC